MTLVVALFLAGLLLIAAEVLIPGGVIGILGVLLLAGGVYSAYAEYGSTGLLWGSVVAIVLVGAVLAVELVALPKTKIGRHLFLSRSVQGRQTGPAAEDSDIGKTCQTVTPLAPTGFILLDGRKLEAASRSGFIDKNEPVKIVGKESFRLIVSKAP